MASTFPTTTPTYKFWIIPISACYPNISQYYWFRSRTFATIAIFCILNHFQLIGLDFINCEVIFCYHQFQIVYLKMDNQIKMNLRTHRPRDYTATESQNPDDFRYSRPNYAKEYISPALELNSAAKLLSKFLNSINKQLREKMKNDEVEEKAAKVDQSKLSQKGGEKDLSLNNLSRKNLGRKQLKQDRTRKETEKRQQSQSTEKQRLTKPGSQSASLNIANYDPDFYKVLAQINQGKATPGSNFNASMNMQAVNKAIIQQQSYVTNNRYFKEGDKKNEESHHSQNQIKNKLFGRSSYHVAIAYHIHLKKIYQRGGQVNQSMLDPTYPAKKFKGEQEMGA